MARAAAAAGADGLMIEVHAQPEQALSDGPQALLPDQFDDADARGARHRGRCVGRTRSSNGSNPGRWRTAGLPGRVVRRPGERGGEVVFNTSMTGYQEILTDPSYRGQIVDDDLPADRQLRRQRRGRGVATGRRSRASSSARSREIRSNFRSRQGSAAVPQGARRRRHSKASTRAPSTRHLRVARRAERRPLDDATSTRRSLVAKAQDLPQHGSAATWSAR